MHKVLYVLGDSARLATIFSAQEETQIKGHGGLRKFARGRLFSWNVLYETHLGGDLVAVFSDKKEDYHLRKLRLALGELGKEEVILASERTLSHNELAAYYISNIHKGNQVFVMDSDRLGEKLCFIPDSRFRNEVECFITSLGFVEECRIENVIRFRIPEDQVAAFTEMLSVTLGVEYTEIPFRFPGEDFLMAYQAWKLTKNVASLNSHVFKF